MNKLIVFLLGLGLWMGGYAESADSVSPSKQASFIEAYGALGNVFQTNDFVKDIPSYHSFSLRYAFASNGNSWEDIAYNMPFWGIGFYMPFFTKNPGLGNPYSFYFFRGSTLGQFTDNLGLILELNLGLSMNWKHYDALSNPDNVAIGSSNNAHVGLRLYLEYFLSKDLDLKFGVDLNHFSNGSSRLPNRGVNMGALSLSLAYHINPPEKGYLLQHSSLKPPVIPRHIDHEAQFVFSNRQTKFSTEGTGLTSQYIDKNFSVLGLIYSPMIAKGHKYKWGPSILLMYDESSNAKAWRDSEDVLHVKTANFSDQLSIGLALRGEISMPIASVYASVGYNVYHKHHFDKAFFQNIGIKAYFKDNFYGAFGISATDFSIAQFLYWSFGYTFSSNHY